MLIKLFMFTCMLPLITCELYKTEIKMTVNSKTDLPASWIDATFHHSGSTHKMELPLFIKKEETNKFFVRHFDFDPKSINLISLSWRSEGKVKDKKEQLRISNVTLTYNSEQMFFTGDVTFKRGVNYNFASSKKLKPRKNVIKNIFGYTIIKANQDNDQDVKMISDLIQEASNAGNLDYPGNETSPERIKSNLGLYYNFFIAINDQTGKGVAINAFLRNYNFKDGRSIVMQSLYVTSTIRQSGLGTKLIKVLAQVAKDEGARIEFTTGDSNEQALSLYLKLGAKKIFSDSRNKSTYIFDQDAIDKMLIDYGNDNNQ